MKRPSAGGGWPALFYTLRKGREAGGIGALYRALRTKNACKACALGMGGARGGMVDESGHRFEVCKKSIQAMAADMQGRIRPEFFSDFSIDAIRAMSPRELEFAGRIVEPMYKGRLDDRYHPISWADAFEKIGAKLRATPPRESFFYFSGRSSNEAGFLLQLVARLYGTNNVNNCSYYCHQASGVGLTSVTGSGTATVVLEDVDKCDLLILIGANPASNHPRLLKHIVNLRRRGGRVIVINPLRELGLEQFRVPSDVRSMLFGSKIADDYIQPNIGGDLALLSGIARVVMERGGMDQMFIDAATEGFAPWRDHVMALSWADIERESGVHQDVIERIATQYLASKRTIFAWAMGITHHEHGVENVQAIGNLALLRGMVGRRGAGLLPLRGHSNVQGIGSVGVTPRLKQAIFDNLESRLDVALPTDEGLDTLGCMDRAHAGDIRFALCLGGNLYGSNPDHHYAAAALNTVDMMVYLNTTLNTGHAWGTARETLILPVLARDEEPEATTQESMFNYVRLSEGGAPRHDGPRSEVSVIAEIAERVLGADTPIDLTAMRETHSIRAMIADVVPGYDALRSIEDAGEFHIAGRTFHEPRFATESGRARFHDVTLTHPPPLGADEVRLMTIRSEGQFNTVVYEEEDLYRGQDRRDIIMLNARDIDRLGLDVDQCVTVRSTTGALSGVRVRRFDVAPGNAAMYFPEANVLIPRTVDGASRTPAFKHIRVSVTPDAPESGT